MTAPDQRLDEIQARLEPALFHAPYIVDGRRVIQANNHPSIRPYMLSDNSMPVIAEFIANAPADLAFLLAELRKAREALARVEVLADQWTKRGEHDMAFSKTAPDEDIAMVLLTEGAAMVENARHIRAAVAAAKGDERG